MTHPYRGLLLILVFVANGYLGNCSTVGCESPQYLTNGELDSINCSFDDTFLSVLWFDTMDYTQSEPILRYQHSTKSGAGYESGEFDIFSNGSLVLNNVSLQHDTTFTAVYVHTRKDDISILNVVAIVLVKPESSFPIINRCGYSRTCFCEVTIPSAQCSVDNARPNVTLQWLARTKDGDKNISQDMSITSEGVGYTSCVTTRDVFNHSSLLVLLICKASSHPRLLQRSHSVILVQNGNFNISLKERQVVYIEQYTTMILNCTDNAIGFFVWKKMIFHEKDVKSEHAILMYSIRFGEKTTEIFASDVSLGSNTSLVVDIADVRHEGLYYCIYGDGVKDGITVYEVRIKVNPVPPYPVIEGCNPQQYCVIEADYESSLTCKLKGIRPQVLLEWNTFLESDAASVSFTNQQLTIKENDETFDVTLTTKYRVLDRSRDRLTIQCGTAEANKEMFDSNVWTTKMDLLFLKDKVNPTTETNYPDLLNRRSIIIPLLVVLSFLLLALLCGVVITKYFRRRNETKTLVKKKGSEEVSVMLTDFERQNLAEIKAKFLRQIKGKYKDLYDAVQPIPYIKDRLYCVDKVFVEGGIEFLESVTTGGRRGEWRSLESYQNIFRDSRVKSTRRIIEGEPGYGKSTVTLQFAYDWCTSNQASALKDVELLILIRLRQLGGVSSIYRAIKQFLLPKDTTLTEEDIKKILKNCASVVLILDGFDEYPDQDTATMTDVMNIIARNMFQEFEVVTTTRSSVLPKKYPPLTKRVKLTGFDDNSRKYYIRKAVVGNDDERVRKIELHLQGNPILSDLCQVPLLFVIFAHMTNESEKFRNLNSVTSFFRHMISCFHSHMRNKMKDENVRNTESLENNHHELDRVAFKALSGNAQKIVWEKEQLRKDIGRDFYDQYIRIGILVEEELIDITDDPGTLITENEQYKTVVRFYHKLFCEWYAAHYLSDYLMQNPTVDLSVLLQHLDPFDVQYLYRFSCGINTNVAEKLISYLNNVEGGDKFAILCILEQSGEFNQIKETVRQLCSEYVIISASDSLLLQRSSMQLLEIAARNDIPIQGVILHNSLQSVDLSTAAIKTTSGLAITSRIPLQELMISLLNRDLTNDEAAAILKFSSMCPSLLKLWYNGCVPPRSFQEHGSTLSNLKSRKVSVHWQWTKDKPVYSLNLKTGKWENPLDGSELTANKYKRMLSKQVKMRKEWTEEAYAKRVLKARNIRRQDAKET